MKNLSRWVVAFLALAWVGSHPLTAQDSPSAGAVTRPIPTPPASEAAAVVPAMPDQELPEVMARGPVHEAFAEPVSLQVQAGLLVPVQPPPNVEETPPAERPLGEQFVWVPGYWAWDADRNGYIWVSGCWRIAPPGMRWVSGYWTQAPDGWQWVAGFWAPDGVQEVAYLPAPPAPDDVESPGPAPDQDSSWVAPCWYWYQGQYIRRSGYWLAVRPDWVWMPSSYVWTPRGYVMVGGHWDYPLVRRGVLFAPVCFPPSVYGRRGIRYSPGVVIDIDALTINLFAYPRYRHYYFGDYYDDAYLRIGIYPWFDRVRIVSWCDPIFTHDRWRHRRNEPNWEARQRHDYDQRRAQKDLRPARTYREQESRAAGLPAAQRQNTRVVQPLNAAIASGTFPARFEKIAPEALQKITRQGLDGRQFPGVWNGGQAVPGPTPGRPVIENRQPVVRPAPSWLPAASPAGQPDRLTPYPSARPLFQQPNYMGGRQTPSVLGQAPWSTLSVFGNYQGQTEIQNAAERAQQNRQSIAPAAPRIQMPAHTFTPPPASQPENAPRWQQPAYTPPAAPRIGNASPQQTPPAQSAPDSNANSDPNRGNSHRQGAGQN